MSSDPRWKSRKSKTVILDQERRRRDNAEKYIPGRCRKWRMLVAKRSKNAWVSSPSNDATIVFQLPRPISMPRHKPSVLNVVARHFLHTRETVRGEGPNRHKFRIATSGSQCKKVFAKISTGTAR